MPVHLTLRALGVHLLLAVFLLCTTASVHAQIPALMPTTDTSIVVNGVLHFSSIVVPAGVTVRFVVPVVTPPPFAPAVILCDGDAIIHGTMSVWGGVQYVSPFTPAAGSVSTGGGSAGFSCASGTVVLPPGGGRHAGSYGSVLPFSLEGGSPGGYISYYSDPMCLLYTHYDQGGHGGGTLALLALGRIEIHGTVTADGTSSMGVSGGSGGSILLRGGAGVVVPPGGTVTARGGTGGVVPPPFPPQFSSGDPGYIRLDSWGTQPIVAGTVTPLPTTIELPYLRTQSPPRVGTTWILDAFAPENAMVFFAASLTPGSGVVTPFGRLGLDLSTGAPFAMVVPPPGHDPIASVATPLPNAPALVGMQFWVQALAVPTALPARLTNTLALAVQ